MSGILLDGPSIVFVPPMIFCGGMHFSFNETCIYPQEDMKDGSIHALVMASPAPCVDMVDLDKHPEHVTGPGRGTTGRLLSTR